MPKSWESILGTKPLMNLWEYLAYTLLAAPILTTLKEAVFLINILVLIMSL